MTGAVLVGVVGVVAGGVALGRVATGADAVEVAVGVVGVMMGVEVAVGATGVFGVSAVGAGVAGGVEIRGTKVGLPASIFGKTMSAELAGTTLSKRNPCVSNSSGVAKQALPCALT